MVYPVEKVVAADDISGHTRQYVEPLDEHLRSMSDQWVIQSIHDRYLLVGAETLSHVTDASERTPSVHSEGKPGQSHAMSDTAPRSIESLREATLAVRANGTVDTTVYYPGGRKENLQ